MIQGKWFPPGSDLTDALSVRREVFSLGRDALDDESWSTVVYLDGAPAATGRLWWRDGAFRIGEIGVTEPLRGKKLGDLVLRLLLFKAQSHAAREVRLKAGPDVAGFFTRLGFREDPSLPEEGGPAEMLLRGDEIRLDSCAACKKENCPNRV